MTKRAGEAHGEFVRDRLPPRDVQLHDPRRDGLLETPLDERGLVDLDRLVDLARATVSPEFGWESRENDVHHLQWPRRHYDIAGAMVDVETQVFRNLVNRKAYVPRIFHNWVHYITAPPRVPSEEVMRYSIDAQRVAMSLSRTAQLATKLARHSVLPPERLRERLDQEFENYNLYIDNAREVPREFSLMTIEELEMFEARSVDDLLLLNKRLGKKALDRIPVVQRRIRPAA